MYSKLKHNRPDIDSFEVGALYVDTTTDEVVEFIGVAAGSGVDGEDVAVFRFSEIKGGCLIATRADYLKGNTFTPAGDAATDEIGDGN